MLVTVFAAFGLPDLRLPAVVQSGVANRLQTLCQNSSIEQADVEAQLSEAEDGEVELVAERAATVLPEGDVELVAERAATKVPLAAGLVT